MYLHQKSNFQVQCSYCVDVLKTLSRVQQMLLITAVIKCRYFKI